ncbi:MAG: hypothetical protein EGQ40_00590, partial [Clostridiales bacterium]|nr:hypothetical protein [Clostridiales bacterium]
MELGWGEHLDDLRVRSHIGSRMFQTAVTFGAGTHCFRHDFQRIGMRCLEVHLHPLNGGTAQCLYAGVRPLDYPVTERGEFYCSDRLHMQIYRTAVHTLRLCMHEHYEDCPWREQALYAMDSLNQAVCGYYCFGEYAFAGNTTITDVTISDGIQNIREGAFADCTNLTRVHLPNNMRNMYQRAFANC